MKMRYIVIGAFCWAKLNGGLSDFNDGIAALLVLNEQLRTISANDIRIEPYTYSASKFADIKTIVATRIFIEGKEYSYAQLIGADEQKLLDPYKEHAPPARGQRFIIKTAHNKIVGFAQVSPYKYVSGFDVLIRGEQAWIVHEMALAPSHLRSGIGRRLFDHMAQWAQQESRKQGKLATYLYVSCANFNKFACEAYKKWTDDTCQQYTDTTFCKKDLMTDPEFRKLIKSVRSF